MARTATAAGGPPPQVRRSSRAWWLVGLLVLLTAGGAAAAVLATRDHGPSKAAPPAKPVTRTITTPQVTHTVTATPPPPPTTEPTTSSSTPASGGSGAQLNAAGYAKMQAGDYHGALPLLEQAVQSLRGSGRIDEAYADYNLAYTRYALDDCTDVLRLLDAAQAIEGRKTAIDQLRRRATKTCR